MGYRVTKTLTTTNGNTYADTDAWIADHGPCGTGHASATFSSLTRIDDTSVRRVIEYADEAAYDTHKAGYTGDKNYSTTDITAETF